MKLKKVQTSRGILYEFKCPACRTHHAIDSTWNISDAEGNPTANPSVLYREFMHPTDDKRPTRICHFYIRSGEIQYLSDCTHELKNQTVEMVDF